MSNAIAISVLLAAMLGTSHAAGSLALLNEAIERLRPGSPVEVPEGTYTTERPIRIEGKRGTAEAPIILRATHRGRSVIDGKAGFVIRDCEHLVLDGFVLANDADQPGVLLENSRQVRVTRNTFRLEERAKPRRMEHWLYVIGERSGHNRIDHNLFTRKANPGSHVFVRGSDTAFACSQHDRIDHNHFRDVVFAHGANGHETIRTGSNLLGATGQSSFTVIEHNLLEQCSGETEVMSLKSSDNIVRQNTLLACRGAICLRLGNRNVVSGNFFLAPGREAGCGGVKLYGYDHRVFNNYFLGLTGAGHDAPLALIPGTLDTPAIPKDTREYGDLVTVPPTRAWIAFNTWIDCAPLQFGFEQKDGVRKHVPTACVFENNLVARTKPQTLPLVNLGLVRALKAHGNLGYSVGARPKAEWVSWFRWEDPRLTWRANPGLWFLTRSSPAINAATEETGMIDRDLFGRPRMAPFDTGAEEFEESALLNSPLTPEAVGPDAP